MRTYSRRPRAAVATLAAPLALGVMLSACAPIIASAPDAAAPVPIATMSQPANAPQTSVAPAPTNSAPLDRTDAPEPQETLLNTGDKVPCLDAFEALLVEQGFATWDDINAIPRSLLENEIIAEAASAGITIDQLCQAVETGFADFGNVLEA